MYLHIGGDVVVSFAEIIGVFDIKTRQAKDTEYFLRMALEEGFVVSPGDGVAKSFVVSNRNKVYYSPIASSTLRKRWMQLAVTMDGGED